MRQLYHPAIEDVTVEGILYALSDPVRVQIFMDLMQAECAKSCSTYLNINKTPLPKSTLSQHFLILREAGLIRSEKKGVTLYNQTRCAEIKARFGDMVGAIVAAYSAQHGKQKRKTKK